MKKIENNLENSEVKELKKLIKETRIMYFLSATLIILGSVYLRYFFLEPTILFSAFIGIIAISAGIITTGFTSFFIFVIKEKILILNKEYYKLPSAQGAITSLRLITPLIVLALFYEILESSFAKIATENPSENFFALLLFFFVILNIIFHVIIFKATNSGSKKTLEIEDSKNEDANSEEVLDKDITSENKSTVEIKAELFDPEKEHDYVNERASEKQIVIVKGNPNKDILSFYLRVETCNHLELGKKLFEVRGIQGRIDGFPLCMNHKGNYDISLEKANAFTWAELMPKIVAVFENYFLGGVEMKFDEKILKIVCAK